MENAEGVEIMARTAIKIPFEVTVYKCEECKISYTVLGLFYFGNDTPDWYDQPGLRDGHWCPYCGHFNVNKLAVLKETT